MVSKFDLQIFEMLIKQITLKEINEIKLNVVGYNNLLELRNYYENIVPEEISK